MFKKILIVLCLFSVIAFSGCSNSNQTDAAAKGKLKVSVTFNAMKELVQAVGGDKVYITTIIPDGSEPHDFEPKGKDMASLSTADVFVYSGVGMESWVDNAVKAVDNKKLITVEASKGVDLIALTDADEIKEHGKYDPHTWLSVKNAAVEAKSIKDALIKADAANKDYYEKNCDDFTGKLDSIYNDYSAKFKDVKARDFVTGHAAFAYLCRDFGLKQNSVEDVFASGEPTAQKLTELADYCKANNVKTVFVESMVSADVSRTLADQVGAKVKTIYTIESSEDNKDYLERISDNLNEIYESLL